MDITKISAGHDVPNDLNVVIEISQGGQPIKYEIDKDSGALFVDRFLHTSMLYPTHYGFVPHTLSEDGDPIDVMVLGNMPVMPGCVIRSRPIGVLMMEDESGVDEKILAVPVSKLNKSFDNIQDLKDVPEILLDQIKHFYEHYKDLEPGKWVKVQGWADAAKAKTFLIESVERYQAKAA